VPSPLAAVLYEVKCSSVCGDQTFRLSVRPPVCLLSIILD